jgi:uncharacterized protein (DUF1330 family)
MAAHPSTLRECIMTVYVVAQLSFTRREAYDRYAANFLGVFRKFGGRLLAADEHPRVIEGRWDREKIVLLSFPDESSFWHFFESAEYEEIAKDRKAGADTVMLLVEGIAGGRSDVREARAS